MQQQGGPGAAAASAVWDRRIMKPKVAQIKLKRPLGRWGTTGGRSNTAGRRSFGLQLMET